MKNLWFWFFKKGLEWMWFHKNYGTSGRVLVQFLKTEILKDDILPCVET
jgi:hypothetical protein